MFSQRTMHGLVAVFLGLCLGATAWPEDFRVETDVFLNNGKEPVCETLTLFTAGVVYDFMLSEPKQITIFDPRHEQFVLLDPARRMKLTLSRNDVLRFTAALKTPQVQKRDPFFFEPRFEVSFDRDTGWLTLSAERMTYRAKGTKPPDPTVVGLYRRFADWYARLNGTMPGKMPPFARLQLNGALAEKGLIPERVEVTIYPKRRLLEKPLRAQSRHLFIWQLSNTDRKRIEKARNYLALFQPVSFQQFQHLSKVAAGDRR